MLVIRTKHELRKAINDLKKKGKETIALVPTMGALHDGHMKLVSCASDQSDAVVVSIFVNPTQFGEGEDFEAYPRDEAADLQKLKKGNVDIVYVPDVMEMYEPGYCIKITVEENADILCGRVRPDHFDGVATVVTKLFMQVLPDIAVFGEKDYQQFKIINQLVKDIDIPVKVVGVPTIREKSGLAISSRNNYLSKKEKMIAPALHKILMEVRENIEQGENIAQSAEKGKKALKSNGFKSVDYLEVRDAETLELIEKRASGGISRVGRIFVAAGLGKTRLIDNIPVAL